MTNKKIIEEFKSELAIFSKLDDIYWKRGLPKVKDLLIIKIEKILLQEGKEEYKKGYNQCLKDRKLTGERWQHLYL